MDIVIYDPTVKQLELLENLGDFNTLDGQTEGYPISVLKLKVSKNNKDYTLDILIENRDIPKNLLLYENGDIKIKVQDVATIIEAKSSYGRSKDFKDLLNFKNLNFNVKTKQ